MKPVKAMTIRLSATQAEELETVAAVEDKPVSEIIREAIAQVVANRRRDRRFQDSLRERIARAQRMLE